MIGHQYLTLLQRIVNLGHKYRPLYDFIEFASKSYATAEISLLNRKGSAENKYIELIGQTASTLKEAGVGRVYRDLHSCIDELQTIRDEVKGLPSALVIFDSFLKRISALEDALEEFVNQRDSRTLVALLERGDDLFQSYRLTRTYSFAALEALSPPDANLPGLEALVLFMRSKQTFRDVVEKLTAIESLYDEVCSLVGVSPAEFPLQVSRLEVGSLWLKLFGESKVIALITKLLENGAGFVYRNFTREGQLRDIPKQIETINSALGLVEELEKMNIPTDAIKENIQKSSIFITEKVNVLLSGSSEISVNGREHGIRQEMEQLLLEQSKVKLLESGEQTRQPDAE
jgi:hypothetical protein